MALPKGGPRDRIEALVLRAVAALPERVVRRLAGEPVRIDGQELSPQAQLLLRLMELSGGGRYEELAVAEAREEVRREAAAVSGTALAVGSVEDLELPGPAGSISARLFRPVAPAPSTPLLVYFHGGGHVVGDLDTHEPPCRFFCREVAAPVLAIHYRRGPEHPFPAAVEDAVAAFAWAHEHADELGADSDRIAVLGDSAGGNLAAVVANRAAAQGGPAPAFQALIYPVTDYATRRRSYELFGEGFFLTTEHMDWYRDRYFADPADRAHPDASPINAPDLTGVCPAYVLSCGFDPLRDEAEDYAQRLREAGVEVTLRREADLVHGFINVIGLGGRALEAAQGVAAAMREGLATARGGTAATDPAAADPAAQPQGGNPLLT